MVFPKLAEYHDYLTAEETFRQAAVIVKQQANQNLRDQFESMLAGAGSRYDEVSFLVITETGSASYFNSLNAAQDWARSQNKVCAIGEIRGFQIVDLSEAEIAARVGA